jgi:hypothetical protein
LLNARAFKAGVFVAAPTCGNVIFWDVFEIEDGLFSKAMLAFNDECPKDVAESLFRLSVPYMKASGASQRFPHTLIFL